MCGRFTQRADAKKIAKEFGVAEVPAVEARYNIAPTQEVLAVYERGDGREATFFKWGLVPSWAKDTSMGARLINARSETVAEKPAFRAGVQAEALHHPGGRLLRVAANGREEAALLLPDAGRAARSASPGCGSGGRARAARSSTPAPS